MNSTLRIQKNYGQAARFIANKRLLKTALWLAVFCFGLQQTNGQVASNYNAEHVAITPVYANLSTSKTELITGAWDNNAAANINFAALNFDFTFNGGVETQAWVSPNGFITFGSAPTTTNYAPIASSETYTGAVAGFALNLGVTAVVGASPQTNSVAYERIGTIDGQYILKIEWRDFKRNVVAGSEAFQNLQIWLYEATGVIEVHLRQISGVPSAFQSDAFPQIGLRGADNTDWNLFENLRTTWPNSTAFDNFKTGDTGVPTPNNAMTVRSRIGTTIGTSGYRLFRFTPVTCTAPSDLAIANLLINSVTLNYTEPAPVPANPYEYEVRTAGAAGSPLGPNDVSGTATGGTINVTGLTANTSYTAYVRSDCGSGDYSAWVQVGPFRTLCNALTVPYLQDFESASLPALPPCTSRQNVGTGNDWKTTNTAFDSGFFDQYLLYEQIGTEPANAWFYTEGISLTSGTSYRMSYQYGGSSSPSYVSNKLEVKYGLQPQAAFMTVPVDNHPNVKASPTENVVYFTPSATGIFYFGFRVYSLQAQGKMFLEEIQIIEADCAPPTALTASSIASTSATVSWTAPTPAPASGYAYYITTTNPIQNISTANLNVGQVYTIASVGTTNFIPLGAASNTIGQSFVVTAPPISSNALVTGQTYTINVPGTTNWTLVGAPSNNPGVQFIATGTTPALGGANAIPATIVGTGTGTVLVTIPNNISPSGTTGAGIPFVNLTGLANNTTYYVWVRGRCGLGENSPWSTYLTFTTLNIPAYCVPSSSGSHTYINNFTTTNGVTNIANVSGFALPSGYVDYTILPGNIVTQSPNRTVSFTVGITTPINAGIAIWVDWNNDGDFVDAGERVYNSGMWVTGATGTFTVPPSQPVGTRRMRVMADYWATNPTPCVIDALFGGQYGEVEDYNFVVVPTPPNLTLSSNSVSQCAGTATPVITLTAGGPPVYNTYTWSPAAGVTGNATVGWTFTNPATTVYTLTAVQTSAPFAYNIVKFTYTATSAPSPVTVTPTTVTICQSGPAQLLTASGGIVNNSLALNETFEAGAPTWIRNNNSTGGAVVNAAWTDRPNGYNYNGAMSSNDASTFVMTNSDAQGSGTTTSTYLRSPVFSLANYANASLKFHHYYRGYVNGSGKVQISTDGGATFADLRMYSTLSSGTRTAFQEITVDLTPYLGQTNLRIQFFFEGFWSWYWAVDNVSVVGTKNAQLVWDTVPPTIGFPGTPIPGLFTDAAATIPYTINTISNTVYTLPTVSRDYTVGTTASGCSVSATVAVTVINVVPGTVAGGGQVACNPADLTNLTLSGHTGDIIRWEYANDAAFTMGVTTIANTTITLTPAEFGTFSNMRYFRAVVGNIANSCALRFTPSVSINLPATTQSGTNTWSAGTPDITKRVVITGDYTVTSDISACSIEVVLGATMTVTNNATVTVTGGITIDPMALPNAVVFETNTSLIQTSTSNTINSGSARYVRESSPIIQYDYTYWSSPVDNQIIKNFSPNTNNARFYTFDSSPGVYAWSVVPSVTSHLMEAAKGYIIRAPNTISTTVPAPWNGEFYGRLRNGSYSIPISVNGMVAGVDQNRNLLGNPYPSAIDADLLWAENSSTLTGNFYFWTHNTPSTGQTYTANDYAQYNASGGTGTSSGSGGVNNTPPDGNIAAGQGFFAEGLSSGLVTFNNTIRIAGNNGLFYRSSQSIEKHRVWLNVLNNQGAFKQTLVGYIEGATNERDLRFDGEYVETGNVVALYSLLNQEKLTIQGRALPFMDTDEVPLGFKTTIDGTFQIQLADFDGLFTQGQGIYLEDKLLNVIHDLRTGDYSFATNAGTFEDRFELQFINSTLSVPTFNEEMVVVYKNNQTIFINSGVTEMKQVRVMDLRGRLIAEKDQINATEVNFSNLNSAQQVLLVQITTVDGTVVTKRVIY